jgi:DeoR family suf operon transcriptional repressor
MATVIPVEAAPLVTLPTTRRALLTSLKQRGDARADDLAADLSITVSAVRQHLAGLMADGLVTYSESRGGPGRPKHVYQLSDAGDALFPRAYGELAAELLEYVEDEDPALVERVFERRRKRRVERAQLRLGGRPLPEQVAELTTILDEDGYLASFEPLEGPDGEPNADVGWRIVEHNCAILAVAAKYGTACGTELEFLREVLPDATVERVAHVLAGGHVCAYEVRPRGGQGSRTTSEGSLSIRSPR